ncbi:hypothetical protein LTR62_004492 [Meristemomyces frigidus]|uniref:Mus7/MMS22 family-domain-containing protein n=1 Tax=Meristemomyces frigidus TaxID=1508187 RepID=A0AAN7TEM1_9PEZI|nr:hypothetical protein LTR62_004492 [Meristemomyces frigidus]
MKRWQDRGEVQDSDDEDLSLTGESQSRSPECARKKSRLDSEGVNVSTGPVEADNERVSDPEDEQEAWLKPRIATTCGRRGKFPKPDASQLDHHGLPSVNTPRQLVHVAIPSLAPGFTPQLFTEDSSPPASSPEDLPNPSQLIADRLLARPVTPQQRVADLSTAESSPLSELGGTPTSPEGLCSRTPAQLSPSASLGTTQEDVAELIIEGQNTVIATGRRALRARTEKQLHPYVFEKTLYQQQWKQRGLKPIRVIDQRTVETQDQSYSGDESQSPQQQLFSSSPARPSPELGGTSSSASNAASTAGELQQSGADGEDAFPDIDTLLRPSLPGIVGVGWKRRKLARTSTHNNEHEDIFSIPRSPPPTSSDSQDLRARRTLPSGFMLPLGMTPVPLPTPQVSSSVHDQHHDCRVADRSLDSSPRVSRPSTISSTISRNRLRPVIIESSTEPESDQESEASAAAESETEERKLIWERKRIKGVLPASWLKIDLKAQSRGFDSPPRARRSSTPPPLEWRPTRGIAQRVPRAFATPRRPITLVTSEDEADSDSQEPPDEEQPLPQPLTQLQRHVYVAAADEQMELDWVDPMLIGSSRTVVSGRRRKQRQPRIADNFLRAGKSADSSNSVAATRRSSIACPSGVKGTHKRPVHAARRHRARVPRLSILDQSPPSQTQDANLPTFVRLAQRQARRQVSRGRHSPSSKIIRLATAEDTEDAEMTLRAWREGIIAQRALPAVDVPKRRTSTQSTTHARRTHSRTVRLPLVGVANNQQRRLPSPMPQQSPKTNQIGRLTTTQPVVRPRQTRLQYDVLEQESGLERVGIEAHQEPSHVTVAPPAQSRRLIQRDAISYRGGQLESLESAYHYEHRAAAFERKIACLTEAVSRGRVGSNHAINAVENYLNNEANLPPVTLRSRTAPCRPETSRQPLVTTKSAITDPVVPTAAHAPSGTLPPVRVRKQRPQHIDTQSRRFRQPSEPLPPTRDDPPPQTEIITDVNTNLKDLGPSGTRYATDFDVHPLPLGTYFHSSTFIGSGDFAASLRLADRDLSLVTGRIRVHVDEQVLEWGAWTEDVATGLAKISRTIETTIASMQDNVTTASAADAQISVVHANVDHMLRSLVRYVSKCLAFLDTIDRRSYLQHMHTFIEQILDVTVEHEQGTPGSRDILISIRQYALVLSSQVCYLASHDVVFEGFRQASQRLQLRVATSLVSCVHLCGFERLRSFYEDCQDSTKREMGMRDNTATVSSIVLLRYCLRQNPPLSSTFWQILFEAVLPTVNTLDTVCRLDRAWYDFFSVLPALEIDDTGIARPGRRYNDNEHALTLPKALVSRLLHLMPKTADYSTMVGLNDYLQATFTRCFLLIDRWACWRCDSVLATMFDFFAGRNLSPLPKEQCHGSPLFLQELGRSPSLEVQPSDPPFHVFLKILATGLLSMQKSGRYPAKKIAGIVWRMIPSHNRTYAKDAEVQEADIEALRNHHDLLCTLYYAAPASYRPRVGLLQDLVDHARSHREACRINVRAWANLISFQVSCDEVEDRLQPFLTWYRDMAQTTMMQFRLAKTEAESDFAAARAEANNIVTKSTLESVIGANQRRIVATLVDALAGLTRAVKVAKNLHTVVALVQGTDFWVVLTPFDTTEKRLLAALVKALEVARATLDVQQTLVRQIESQNTSEESQEFGDSSALHELVNTQHASTHAATQATIFDFLHISLRQLLSTVFGADVALEDHILAKIVDIWVRLAGMAVSTCRSTWGDYLGSYHADSWLQLRDTEQKRKFTPYFFARVLAESDADTHEVADDALRVLLASLAEREALLKHQHLLLCALLNTAQYHPTLENLPFSADYSTGRYTISLHELRQRRLALISSILLNIRLHYDNSPRAHKQEVQKQYAGFLRALMQAMKSNFIDLQGGSHQQSADASIQGAYVDFVQYVVSCLQQHTTDICSVDKFFTDSTAFPLPATDPMYVVGRLRSFTPKLRDSSARKQLTMFVQTVVERAVVGGHSPYLVDQLCTAMETGDEHGSQTAPSLRLVLLTTILSPYLEAALGNVCSWMLALPILTVYGTVVGNLIYNIDLRDEASIYAVEQIMMSMLCSLQVPLQQSMAHPGLMRLPHVQRVLSEILGSLQRLLTLCDYLRRNEKVDDGLAHAIRDIHMSAVAIQDHLRARNDEWTEHTPDFLSTVPCWWPDTKQYARDKLREALESVWHAHDGQYFVRRGSSSIEVVVRLDDEEEERTALLSTVQDFCDSYEAIHYAGQSSFRGAFRLPSLVAGMVV